MAISSALALLAVFLLVTSASPIRPGKARQDSNSSLLSFSLPNDDSEPVLRAAGVDVKQATFLYGPGIGGGPSSPAGPLGTAWIERDVAIANSELAAQSVVTKADSASAILDSAKYNNLETVEDYIKLYDNEWEASSRPTGINPGMLTNYTQDLLFSMERLSTNPYAIRRLKKTETLPFEVGASITQDIAGQDLATLLSEGRLFYADHRGQGMLPRPTDGKFAPACDAYFFIEHLSGDFLPLAIRTNTNNSLVYTPKDSAEDWLLAKMLFNVNDFFMGQFHHLANTHYVAESIYQAAVRTLSDEHPVLALLSRLMYGAFGVRPAAISALLRPGGVVDTYFGLTGQAAADFAADIYSNGYAGAVKSNYLCQNLEKRGLLNDKEGPTLKNLPFYEDAAPVHDAIRTFMGTFVDSYYTHPNSVTRDNELEAWLKEANGPAEVIDFPPLHTNSDLADLLAHFAHLVSSAHHAVNLNQLITGSGVLPFHPTAVYKPIPTSKGVTDVAAYLPPLAKCLGMIAVEANFARPLLAGTNRSLSHMFDDEIMLARMNQATRDANVKFKSAMMARSEVVRARSFDTRGLSQGMPFVWRALDPETVPWSLTI